VKRLLLVAGFVALAATGAAWSYVQTSPPASATLADATTLQLKAIDGIKYDKKTLSAPRGVLKIVLKSASPLKHDVAIKGNGVNVKSKLIGTGGTTTVRATLKPGKYIFYCTVPGHAAAGMKGTLTVR
jgi:uncharacterized cupredoxin-like copper-binding protein